MHQPRFRNAQEQGKQKERRRRARPTISGGLESSRSLLAVERGSEQGRHGAASPRSQWWESIEERDEVGRDRGRRVGGGEGDKKFEWARLLG
jgi:hypothetical protein